MFTNKVLLWHFIDIRFSHIRQLPSSLPDISSDVSLDGRATGEQMKRALVFNKIQDFSGFEDLETFGKQWAGQDLQEVYFNVNIFICSF